MGRHKGVDLGDGTKCYSGPNCKKHGNIHVLQQQFNSHVSDKVAKEEASKKPTSPDRPYENYTPAEVDTILAKLYQEQSDALTKLAVANKYVKDFEERLAGLSPESYYAKSMQESLDRQTAIKEGLLTEIRGLDAKMSVGEEEYARRGRWTRAFLVSNANGHVHRNMECSSCFPTTRYTWLTEYSGGTEEKIVNDAGKQACTVCYPSAPVDVLSRPSKIEAPDKKAAREERERKAAEKAAKEAVTGITTKDGEPLTIIHWGRKQVLKTERTADIEGVKYIYEGMAREEMVKLHGPPPPPKENPTDWEIKTQERRERELVEEKENIEIILEALAYKRLSNVETQREILTEKAKKKIKKDFG